MRLASQLTGWRIDIHSESKVREMEARARQSLAAIERPTAAGAPASRSEALFAGRLALGGRGRERQARGAGVGRRRRRRRGRARRSSRRRRRRPRSSGRARPRRPRASPRQARGGRGRSGAARRQRREARPREPTADARRRHHAPMAAPCADSIRTCIGCRRRAPAGELVRLAAGRTGTVVVAGGARPGRGASLHPRARPASRRALRTGALARAFKQRVDGRRTPRSCSQRITQLRRAGRSKRQRTIMIGSGYERRTRNAGGTGRAARAGLRAGQGPRTFSQGDWSTKVRALGIDVANHMSHLEPADVDRVRRAVERERQESLVEERLNDTVIRRRSKTAAGGAPAARRPPRRAAPPPAGRRRRRPRPRAGRARRRRGRARAAAPRRRRGRAAERRAGRRRAPPPRRSRAAAPSPPRQRRAAPPAAPAPPPAPAERRPRRAGRRARRAAVARRRSRPSRSRSSPARRRRARSSSCPASPPRGDAPGAAHRDQGPRRGAAAPRPQRRSLNRAPGRPRSLRPARRSVPADSAPAAFPKKRVAAAGKKLKQTQITTPAEHKRVVRMGDTIAVSELAKKMAVKGHEIIKKLWALGMMGVEHQPGHRPRHRDADRHRVRLPDRVDRVPRGRGPHRRRDAGQPRGPGPARAGGHHHGPRRPRQDVAARRHPQGQRRRRARRAASPSTSAPTRCTREQRRRRVPRHAGPRGVHRHARPRRPDDRHRRAGRRRRRRADAADHRGDQPRQGGGGADRRRGQQDRQAGRQPGPDPQQAVRARPGLRGVGRRRRSS